MTIFILTLNKGLDLEIFSIALIFLAFFLFYRISDRFFNIRPVRTLIEELSQVTVQIKVRGAIAILMAFVVLAGLLGLELILGAFLAGMIISLLKTPEDTDLIHKLEAFGFGFFIPVFFILVGVNLEIGSLISSPSSLIALPLLLLASIIVKGIPFLFSRKYLSWREALAGGALLNTHLSLEIAVAVIGFRLGLISEAANATIILFAIGTILIMPLLFNFLMPQTTSAEKRWTILYGADDLAMQVADILRKHDENICFIDPDKVLVDQSEKSGYELLPGDTISECIQEANKHIIEAFILLSSDDAQNLSASRTAKILGSQRIIALVNDPARMSEYRQLGVTPFTPALYNPSLLALMARNPDFFQLLTQPTDDQDVREMYLGNPTYAGNRIRSLGLPGNLLVLAIGRENEILVPHGNTQVELGDRLTIFGNIQELNEASYLLEAS